MAENGSTRAPQPDPLLRYVPRFLGDWEVTAGDSPWQVVDCTVAFFDVSGFTTLSERLAHHGRIGAEDLTRILDLVFGDMMDRAYEWGGSLVKFGGDALLMVFTGEDHVRRACNAAVEMRAALRRHANTPTVAGRARLRVSIGIHTGSLDLFRVGDLHHELLVAGPTATTVAQTESSANPGEIAVTDAVRDQLPPDAVRPRPGIGHTLRWRTARGAPTGFTRRAVVSGDAIVNCVALGLRDHLAAGIPEPEHRQATAGFVKIDGVDDLLATDGHDRVAKELNALVSAIQQIAADEEVVILNSDIVEGGVKLTLTAGVPYTLRDDEGRMLRAVRRIVETPTVFTIKIGVHHGHMFAGDIGSEHRGSFTIMGDLVNVAARFMGQAQPGAVLADPSTLDRSSTRFAVRGPFELDLKGRQEPAVALEVGEVVGQRSRQASELPFVGRLDELAVLRRRIADGGGSLILKGDTGSGKTRLVTEASSDVGDAVLRVTGEPHIAGTLYGAFTHALGDWLGITDGTGAALVDLVSSLTPADVEMAPLVGDVLGIAVPMTDAVAALETRFRTARTADVVGRLLAALGEPPRLLWLDDLHWMDGASREMSLRLAAAGGPWLTVIAARTEFDVPPVAGADHLDLPRLTTEEARRLVEELTAHSPLRPRVVAEIIERTDGNPFYLDEMVRLALAGADLDSVPESLDATVGAQVDRLKPADRRLARFASVLGTSFEVDVLAEVLAMAGVDVSQLDLLDGDLEAVFQTAGPGRVAYRHATVRRVAYEALSFGRRSELHRMAARVLTDRSTNPDAIAAVLSLHHSEGGEPALAWRYSVLAGDEARRQYANDEAAVFYERGLAAVEDVSEIDHDQVFDVLVALGDVEEQAGRFDDSREAYRRAENLGVSPTRKAHARYRRALAEMRTGRYQAALRSITAGLRTVADQTSGDCLVERARLASLRASVRMAQWKPESAWAAGSQALELADASGDLDSQSRAHLVLHWASIMLGRSDGPEHGTAALELSRAIGDLDGAAHAANNLGGEAYMLGRWDEALDWYSQGEAAFSRAGNEVGAAVTKSNIGEVMVGQRRCADAVGLLRGAVRVLAASSDANDTMFAEVQLARALAGSGKTAQAVQLLSRVFETAEETGQVFAQMEAASHLALTLSYAGRSDEASEVLRTHRKSGGESLHPTTLALVDAMSQAGAGNHGEARATIESGLLAAREEDLSYEEALLIELGSDLDALPDSEDEGRVSEIFGALGVVA